MSKLVRDLIPEVIPENKKEHRKRLSQKLLEEANEYIKAENIEGLADIFKVINVIIKLNSFDKKEIESVKTKKKQKRGGFEKGVFLESASLSMSKLVRDLIPEVIPESKRELYRFSFLNKEEYRKCLNQKLIEEIHEYIEDENIEELADILEVIDAIIKLNGFEK